MKLIQGQYVTEQGMTIRVERHDNRSTPMVSISVNLSARVHIPVKLYLRATRVQRLELLSGVVVAVFGKEVSGPALQPVFSFLELVGEYCK